MAVCVLLVGQEYTRSERLRGIRLDLQRMVLFCQQRGWCPEVSLNETWAEVQARRQRLSDAYILFYYSGHKVGSYFEFPDEYVSEAQIYNLIVQRSKEQLIILDTCFGWITPTTSNTAIFSASTPWTSSVTRPWGSLFTEQLCQQSCVIPPNWESWQKILKPFWVKAARKYFSWLNG